jgi:5'-methylthioadenosine phosphorylase
MEDPARHASVDTIMALYAQTLAKGRALLDHLLAQPLPAPEPEIRGALAGAMLTPDSALDDAQREWLGVLRR